jgi:hypothetical protein
MAHVQNSNRGNNRNLVDTPSREENKRVASELSWMSGFVGLLNLICIMNRRFYSNRDSERAPSVSKCSVTFRETYLFTIDRRMELTRGRADQTRPVYENIMFGPGQRDSKRQVMVRQERILRADRGPDAEDSSIGCTCKPRSSEIKGKIIRGGTAYAVPVCFLFVETPEPHTRLQQHPIGSCPFRTSPYRGKCFEMISGRIWCLSLSS